MFKNLFVTIWAFLASPSKTWDEVAQYSVGDKKYLYGYFYPLMILSAFTAFLNPFIKGFEDLDFLAVLLIGMQCFIVSIASSFFGFFITAKALNYGYGRWFGMKSDNRKAEMLTAYASTPVLVVNFLTGLLSDFFFMKILFLYVIVLVWEATTHFYMVEESKRGRFTAYSSLLILALPIVIEQLFKLLLPGLK